MAYTIHSGLCYNGSSCCCPQNITHASHTFWPYRPKGKLPFSFLQHQDSSCLLPRAVLVQMMTTQHALFHDKKLAFYCLSLPYIYLTLLHAWQRWCTKMSDFRQPPTSGKPGVLIKHEPEDFSEKDTHCLGANLHMVKLRKSWVLKLNSALTFY